MTRNIIFDMGGVILPMQDISEPIRRFRQIGMTEEMALRMFGLHGQQGIFQDVESGKLSSEAFLKAYERLTGFRATFGDIEWAWRGFVCDPPRERLLWLGELRQEGYHVVLLSNTNPFLMHHCDSPAFTPEGKPIAHFFDRVYYSYLLGACKPDPRAFLRMMQEGGYKAEECLFLDDARHNVEAAKKVGMRSLHIPNNIDWIEPLRQALP
ncbi:MAG: HAD family phosphatase [Prevotellaceae bacterium]|nr:HAD family phosphatase [Prevotellaceae bacterium]